MVTDIPPEEFARCLDECAAAILAEAKITEPPIDVIRLAQQLGFVVAVDKTDLPPRVKPTFKLHS